MLKKSMKMTVPKLSNDKEKNAYGRSMCILVLGIPHGIGILLGGPKPPFA
jgi:hypothetical protein